RYVELRREGRGPEAQAALTRTKEGGDREKSSRTEQVICQGNTRCERFLFSFLISAVLDSKLYRSRCSNNKAHTQR
uniref:Uncharacterized protein n=1 Tax=Aegilops tauschii subsp. strangulata TaxID=200361 RepID=A0A453CW68_AEGTS